MHTVANKLDCGLFEFIVVTTQSGNYNYPYKALLYTSIIHAYLYYKCTSTIANYYIIESVKATRGSRYSLQLKVTSGTSLLSAGLLNSNDFFPFFFQIL